MSLKNINTWSTNGTLANPYIDNNLSCFGECPVNKIGIGNCGTDEFFVRNNNLNPKEKEYKLRQKIIDDQIKEYDIQIANLPEGPERDLLENERFNLLSTVFANDTRYWPRWQNYYEYKKDNGYEVGDEIPIPGWGKYTVGQSPDENTCLYCSDFFSIKPYKYYRNGVQCQSYCNIKLQNSFNNQGISVGSINLSLNLQNACSREITNPDGVVNPLDQENNIQYIEYIGSSDCKTYDVDDKCNECTLDSTDSFCRDKCSKWLDCIYNSEICLITDTGDNCMVCENDKSEICCLDPNSIDSEYENKNKEIFQIVGNNISYICQNQCSEGTKNLKELENEKCGTLCNERNNENTCNSCEYCFWNGNECIGICPEGPFNVKKEENIPLPEMPVPPPAQGPLPTEPPISPGPSPIPEPPGKDVNPSVNNEYEYKNVLIGLFSVNVLIFFLSFIFYKYNLLVISNKSFINSSINGSVNSM